MDLRRIGEYNDGRALKALAECRPIGKPPPPSHTLSRVRRGEKEEDTGPSEA